MASLKKIFLIFFIVLFMFTVSGCWDAKDLGYLEIPIAAAYDKDGKNVKVTSISPNLGLDVPKKSRLEVLTAMTVADTRNRRAERIPRYVLVGMLQTALLGEEFARDEEAMRRSLDLYLRSPQTPGYSSVAVTEGPAGKILSTPTENFPNMGVLIIDLLRTAPQNTFMPRSSLYIFGRSAMVKGENPVVPLLKVQNKKVVLAGSAIFKKYKLIDKLNKKETRAMVLLRGENAKGYIPFILVKDGKRVDKGTVYVKDSRKVIVERQGDEYHFKISITLTGTLIEHSNQASLLDKSEQLSEIEKLIQTNMENDCRKFIIKMQNVYGIDCINISQYALAKWRPELVEKIETKDFIQNIKIDVKLKMKIKSIGELS